MWTCFGLVGGGGGNCKEGLVSVSLEKPWRILWCAALEVGWGMYDNPHKKESDRHLIKSIKNIWVLYWPATKGRLMPQSHGAKAQGNSIFKGKSHKDNNLHQSYMRVRVTWKPSFLAEYSNYFRHDMTIIFLFIPSSGILVYVKFV